LSDGNEKAIDTTHMKNTFEDYSVFLRFFESFSVSGVEGIDPDEPIMAELDDWMEQHNQLFYIADAVLFDILFISKGVHRMFGIEPDKVAAGFFLTTTHPDDLKRHHFARTKLLNRAQEIYIAKRGTRIISSNFRAQTPQGDIANFLYQGYLFYSKEPYESVFLILVITNISGFENIHKGFHFYSGNDRQYFRYPDDKLLMSGMIFSFTEFRIIELIEEGLSSKEIARNLFRSTHTINTHRRNILKKSGKSSMTEVIRDLKGKGLL
jgi:DNA-binding CsgD family transcriptional regulator